MRLIFVIHDEERRGEAGGRGGARGSSHSSRAPCCRNVTADAMGMAKERDKSEENADGTRNGNGNKHSKTP